MPITFSGGNKITITGGWDAGTSSGGNSSAVLRDTSKSWAVNSLAGRAVIITGGTGIRQVRNILSNTSNQLTFYSPWDVTPDATSTYLIYHNTADIKAANDAGGWGVVATSGKNYTFSAAVVVGNGTNFAGWSDNNVSLSFSTVVLDGDRAFLPAGGYANAGGDGYFVTLKTFGCVRLGIMTDDATKQTINGCSCYTVGFTAANKVYELFMLSQQGILEILSSTFSYVGSADVYAGAFAPRTNGLFRVYNSTFNGVGLLQSPLTNTLGSPVGFNDPISDAYNTNVHQGTLLTGLRAAPDKSLTRLNLWYNPNKPAAVDPWFVGAIYSFRETVTSFFRDAIFIGCFNIILQRSTSDSEFIDCTADAWAIAWYNPEAFAGNVFRSFSHNFSTKDLASAAIGSVQVAMFNAAGTQVFNLATNGTTGILPEQIIRECVWTKATASQTNVNIKRAVEADKQSYGIHSLVVRKYGYVYTRSVRNPNTKVSETLTLTANPYVVANAATATAYSNVTVAGAAKTITIGGARTLQEIFDYSQAWAAQSGNMQWDEPLTATDPLGFTLSLGWVFSGINNVTFGNKVLSGGIISLSASGTYNPKFGFTTVRFTAAGTYDLRGATISGTLTLTNTSGGAVTVQLQPGVTFVNSGPNITVDNAVSATLTIDGIVSGSSILIRRTDTQAVLANATTATSYTYSYTVSGSIPIEIVVRKATTAPFYQQWRTTTSLSGVNATITASQVLD